LQVDHFSSAVLRFFRAGCVAFSFEELDEDEEEEDDEEWSEFESDSCELELDFASEAESDNNGLKTRHLEAIAIDKHEARNRKRNTNRN